MPKIINRINIPHDFEDKYAEVKAVYGLHMTAEQIADYLGGVSIKTVGRWIRENHISKCGTSRKPHYWTRDIVTADLERS